MWVAFIIMVVYMELFIQIDLAISFILQLNVDLDTEDVVILGQGNVALDVARILLTPNSVLKVGNSVHRYNLQSTI